eukprot:3131286-Pyramimonas_sp.AAC.1
MQAERGAVSSPPLLEDPRVSTLVGGFRLTYDLPRRPLGGQGAEQGRGWGRGGGRPQIGHGP